MIVKGKLFICDRCKKSCFSGSNDGERVLDEPDRQDLRLSDLQYRELEDAENEDFPMGYERIYGMDLCQSCAKDFYKWLKYKQAREEI